MKLLLVDNLIMPEEGSLAHFDVHPHLGLLSLAAAAEADGHEVQIYDPKRLIKFGKLRYDASLYEHVAAELLALRPQAVGFTTLGCSFLFALNVAALLKRREPDLPLLLGGPHATMLHRQILERFPQFDIVARHECDEIFAAVLDGLEQRRFNLIPGMSWRVASGRSGLRFTEGKPKVEDLDTLPIASYDHYPVPELGLELLRIEAGRGCPFMCTFCSTAGFFQRSFRLKSAGRLVRELDILHERYGFRDFKLDHDMFTVNKRKVLEFCEAVTGRGYRWRASARVDCVDAQLLTRMAQAGCVGLYFGIETGSARMQKICQKRLDLSLVHPILELADQLGIETTASFITGYPEEQQQDQNDTLDMLGACFRRSCLPQLHMLAPEPGTPMFEQRGDELQYDGYGGPYNAELVGPEDQALVLRHPDIFQTYYHYPAEMPRARYIFAVEAVAVARRLGPIVLGYVLRAYSGSLSNLVQKLRLFAEQHWSGQAPDDRIFMAYVTATFGQDHHVNSLCRYALAVNEGGSERGSSSGNPPAKFDPDLAYQLSPNVRVLTDIHDCDLLLKRIEQNPAASTMLDQADLCERGVYLLTRSGASTTAYRVESGAEVILNMFREPRRCCDVIQDLSQLVDPAAMETHLLEGLVHARVIVARSATPPSTRAPHVDSLA